MAEVPRMTVEELTRRMEAGEDSIPIDVRNPHAWAESDNMMPGAIRVPLDDFEKHLDRIPKKRPIVTYCT